jgi:alkaline phosphatase D
LNFWRGGAGALAARSGRAGVYEAYSIGVEAELAQLLLLDLRSFRAQAPRVDEVGNISKIQFAERCATADGARSLGEYCAHAVDSTAALLGEEQWAWLEAELRKPAALRVICSSLAFASQFHAMEAWVRALAERAARAVPRARVLPLRSRAHAARYPSTVTRGPPALPQSLHPSERARLIALINATRAEGVVFVSGDVHYAELSRLEPAGMYPLYDLTSSGLNQDWPSVPANQHRVSGPVSRHNWGRIEVDWARRALELQIFDAAGTLALHESVKLDELRFAAPSS